MAGGRRCSKSSCSNPNNLVYYSAMRNPFQYGAKVTGECFFDRIEIKKSILNVIAGGNNAVLYGPRRYGKSSLMAQVVDELRQQGTLCVYLNMMNVATLGDFIVMYAKAIYAQTSPAAGALRYAADMFRRIRPSLGLDEEGRPALSLSVASAKMGVAELREVLELPARLKPKGRDLVIVLDEFQEISGFGLGTQFERTMRSVIENHADISYVFLGSKSHMLKRMFAAPSRPFYRSAQTFSLSLPPADESCAFLVKKFASVGMTLRTDLSASIVERAGNVPYYLQALGSWTFRYATERGARSVSGVDVENAFRSLYDSERELFEEIFRSLPKSQRLVARAIAEESTAAFTEDYRLRHALTSLSTVNTAVRRLVADARIDNAGGRYVHVDPLLAHHLRVTAKG